MSLYWPPSTPAAAAAAAAAAATAALAASTDGSAGAGGGGGEPSASVFKFDILKLFMVGTGILRKKGRKLVTYNEIFKEAFKKQILQTSRKTDRHKNFILTPLTMRRNQLYLQLLHDLEPAHTALCTRGR